jgi:3-hydroxyacyl-CoA dehydrogenase/enoyl-CoA hydratase/3-hydroxybutyryl-CoA epimerase
MYQHLRVEFGSDRIASVRLFARDSTANVLHTGLLADLERFLQELATRPDLRGVLLTSDRGDFLAGEDLDELLEALEGQPDPLELRHAITRTSRLFRAIEISGKPWVAAIHGAALDAGLELALACHYRVASASSHTRLGLTQVKYGLMPAAGGTQRLPRLIGLRPALELMLQGTELDGLRGAQLRVVNEVCSPESLLETARRWLLAQPEPRQPWDQKGFAIPGGADPLHPSTVETFSVGTTRAAAATHRNHPAPLAILSAVYDGCRVPFDRALQVEAEYCTRVLLSGVPARMIRSLVVEKRAADRLVRRPAGIPGRPARAVGVIGAGMMGSGIAHVCASAGLEVILLDTTPAQAERGKAYSQRLLRASVEGGLTDESAAQTVLGRIHPGTDFAPLARCDLVIEAVFEDRQIKADVTARAERALPATALFATNTSTLPIGGLAQMSRRPEQFIGLHFFSPVERMELVEVILGAKTSQATLAIALDFARQIGKTPIVVNDRRGFYTSRTFGTFLGEGYALLEDGVAPAIVENVARHVGMPVGPLAASDEIGLDTILRINRQGAADLGTAWKESPGCSLLRHMVDELGRLGRKSAGGFYDYPQEGRKRLWPELRTLTASGGKQTVPLEHVRLRLLHIQALETTRCLEEQVLTSRAEADLGSLYGWHFPAHTGGTLSYIDGIGLSRFIGECEMLAQHYGERFAPSQWLRAQAAQGCPRQSPSKSSRS